MELPLASRSAWQKWLLYLALDVGLWTLFGLVMTLQFRLNQSSAGGGFFGEARYFLARCWIYAALTPPIFLLAKHFRFSPGVILRSVVLYVLGFVVWDAAYIGLRLVFYPPVVVGTGEIMDRSVMSALALARSTFVDQFWMYLTVGAIALSLQYYRQMRERELRESDLKTKVAEYELQILKLQLHPHFLFNTLNGISTLMTRDVKTAREMIVRLSDLLRIGLSHTSTKEITLRQELEFIDAYLQIEQMRFGPRLQVTMAVSPETLGAGVPNMILQPLVENAVRHGIAPRRSGGQVGIATSRENGHLRIVVSNDGPEVSSPVVSDSTLGLGLGNTRARLLQLYGNAYNLQMEPRREGGVEVRLEIPFREVTEAVQNA